MTRTREDVWTLTRAEGDWPETLVAYEKAVALLRERDPASGPPAEPLGWRFLAAIHGLQAPGGGADASNALWSNCQHGSWFFLPWHRMYLMAFELDDPGRARGRRVVAAVLVLARPRRRRQGGAAARLPRRRPSSCAPSKRSIPANSGAPLPDRCRTR